MAPMEAASSMALFVSSVGLTERMYSCVSASPTEAKSSRSLARAAAEISSNSDGSDRIDLTFSPSRSVSRLTIMLRK